MGWTYRCSWTASRTETRKAVFYLAVAAICVACMLVTTCFARGAFQQASKQDESLKCFLRAYLGPPDSRLEKTDPARYSSATVDLTVDLKDGSGQQLIVYIAGPDWCGSGGCTTLVLLRENSSYAVVARLPITWPPIRMLATKSHGWHDISIQVHGGGIIQPNQAKLSFNGETYAQPGQRLAHEQSGMLIIPETALTRGKLLYR